MRLRLQGALAALTLCGLAFTASGDIVAKVGTVTHNPVSGTLPVPLGIVSSDTDIFIYDNSPDPTTGLPNESLEQIEITGSVQPGTSPRIRILVAQFNTAFPTLPTQTVAPGILNLGSEASNGTQLGGIIVDDTLEAATVLALSASGDVHGNINVGRVFRMQARGVTDPGTGNVSGGHITANIYASAPDLPPASGTIPVLGELAIGVITAHDAITGNIIAGELNIGNDELTGSSSIGRVTVTSEAAEAGGTDPQSGELRVRKA